MIWNFGFLKEIPVSSELKTRHLWPLLIAYSGMKNWNEAKEIRVARECISKIYTRYMQLKEYKKVPSFVYLSKAKESFNDCYFNDKPISIVINKMLLAIKDISYHMEETEREQVFIEVCEIFTNTADNSLQEK